MMVDVHRFLPTKFQLLEITIFFIFNIMNLGFWIPIVNSKSSEVIARSIEIRIFESCNL